MCSGGERKHVFYGSFCRSLRLPRQPGETRVDGCRQGLPRQTTGRARGMSLPTRGSMIADPFRHHFLLCLVEFGEDSFCGCNGIHERIH